MVISPYYLWDLYVISGGLYLPICLLYFTTYSHNPSYFSASRIKTRNHTFLLLGKTPRPYSIHGSFIATMWDRGNCCFDWVARPLLFSRRASWVDTLTCRMGLSSPVRRSTIVVGSWRRNCPCPIDSIQLYNLGKEGLLGHLEHCFRTLISLL